MPDIPSVTPLPMAWVDAFTDRPFSGNPCVVVFGADDVDDAMRTAFTREIGLSECAFLQDSTVADIGVRCHTASGEILMPGHPTIATATALLDRGMVPLVGGRASFTLEVGAGVIPIEIDATGDGPARITMQQLRPTFGRQWDQPDDIQGARVTGTGVVVMRGEVAMPMTTTPTGTGTGRGGAGGGGDGGGGGIGGGPTHLVLPITAADTGVTAFIGETEKNLDIAHARITSMADYETRFGTAGGGVAMATAVRQYFDNGGRTAVIAPATADRASHNAARDALVDGGADLLVLAVHGAKDLPRQMVDSAIVWGEEHAVLVLVDPAVAWRSTDDAIVGRLPSSDHATIWFPRGKDPSGRPVTVTGAIAGVIARTDLARAVWKAPAGTEAKLVGVTAAVSLSREDAADLTAVNVNGIMTVGGTPSVWGARTTSLDPEWRYLAVRRTADWITRSITTSLQHDDVRLLADPAGMAAIANAVSVFLDGIHRQGGFQGTRPSEAWFVRCDDTTTTPADIELGRVNLHLGFAPTRPAEFIVIRISLTLDPA